MRRALAALALLAGVVAVAPSSQAASRPDEARGPWLAPLASARQAVEALGGDLSVTWNRFGTPAQIAPVTGWVDERVTDPRAWVRSHRSLWNLTEQEVSDLEVLYDAPLVNQEPGSPARVTLFRQTVAGLHLVQDGMIALGRRGDRLAMVTSSAVGGRSLNTSTPRLTPLDAVRTALQDVGRPTTGLSDAGLVNGFRTVTLPGVSQPQRARLVVVPTTDRGLRLGWETSLLDPNPVSLLGATLLVDAVDGRVLRRQSNVQRHHADPLLPTPSGPATYRYFENAPIPEDFKKSTDVRVTSCLAADAAAVTAAGKDPGACELFLHPSFTLYDWDVELATGLSTFTTRGNNAQTATARVGTTQTPAEPYSPVSATRDYRPAFTDSWRTSGCNPLELVNPTGADADASTVNLFANHNLTHDVSYRLGFTEKTWNLQVDNRGLGGTGGDPEIGNVQSGATTNLATELPVADEFVGGLGRDNANQLTLADGIPGVTNQYLFQPLLGFYAPCVDGDFDANVFVHEYTHATSNRMVAGPDTGLSGAQGGAMGESWSDQVALEFVTSLGTAGQFGDEPTSSGAYSTGGLYKAFLNYPLGKNPLMHGDIAYDVTGDEVHSDGEIWSGTNWAVRQALVDAWNSRVPYANADLQEGCLLGHYPSTKKPAPSFAGCPGNRRWVQYVFDSFLLQASGEPTMVQMKNNMLAAASMRGSAEDRATMALAFAQRGLGNDASSKSTDDLEEVPGTASPTAKDNSRVTFTLVDRATKKPVTGEVYLGQYQARITPYVEGSKGVRTMAKGTYEVLVRADGFGLTRLKVVVPGGGKPYAARLLLDRNYASGSSGATATGFTRSDDVIDDDEATNGFFDGAGSGTPAAGRTLTVDLHGKRLIGRLSASAASHVSAGGGDLQGRFINLRAFDLQASSDGGKTYRTVYRSPADFFPGSRPRPTIPELILRSATFVPVTADHVRLVVRTNQCTGQKQFQGDLHNDPLNNPDCLQSDWPNQVGVTELQVFAPLGAVPPTPVTPPTGPLPTTGLDWQLPVAGLLLLLGTAVAYRRREARR